MSKATALSLLFCFLITAFSAGALASFMTTIPNTTNTCINSTYKFYSPDQMNPTLILIDRRVTFNPTALCSTASMGTNGCNRDPGSPMLLVASASGLQIANAPFCSWNCGVCGTSIRTDGSSGLPVELMEFSVGEDAVPAGSGDH